MMMMVETYPISKTLCLVQFKTMDNDQHNSHVHKYNYFVQLLYRPHWYPIDHSWTGCKVHNLLQSIFSLVLFAPSNVDSVANSKSFVYSRWQGTKQSHCPEATSTLSQC